MRRPGLFFCLAAAIFALLILAVVYFQSSRPSTSPLPSPNGYDYFLAASRMLPPVDPGAPVAVIERVLKENGDALERARAGLEIECQVPLEYSEQWNSNRMNDLADLKKLAQTFIAEGVWAESEGRFADAARSYFDAMRLGNEIVRGGLVIDQLVGLALEALGLSRLEALGPKLESKDCRETARALLDLDRTKEPFKRIQQREKAWAMRTWGLHKWLAAQVGEIVRSQSLNPPGTGRVEAKVIGFDQKRRNVALDLAARAYELEVGRRPDSLGALVPEYLRAIPMDPVTGKELLFVIEE